MTPELLRKLADDMEQRRGRRMYRPTMQDAVDAGDNILMREQAALLRECRSALDALLADRPQLAAKLCGCDTLGNLRARLYDYSPQGVMGGLDKATQIAQEAGEYE